MQTTGNRGLAIGLVVLALAFFALAGFYLTQQTSLLASSTAIHYKHAMVAGALGVLSLVGANILRPKAPVS